MYLCQFVPAFVEPLAIGIQSDSPAWAASRGIAGMGGAGANRVDLDTYIH